MCITYIDSPFGNFTSTITSEGEVRFSLQWIKVSSISKIKVFLSILNIKIQIHSKFKIITFLFSRAKLNYFV